MHLDKMTEVNYLSRDKSGFTVWTHSPVWGPYSNYYHVHMTGDPWAEIPKNKVNRCCCIDPDKVLMNTVVPVENFCYRRKPSCSFRIMKVDLDKQEVQTLV